MTKGLVTCRRCGKAHEILTNSEVDIYDLWRISYGHDGKPETMRPAMLCQECEESLISFLQPLCFDYETE